MLTISPFRLGEHPNVRVGVAMITSAPEALALHRKTFAEMWKRAMKGGAALRFLNELLQRSEAEAKQGAQGRLREVRSGE
jgi:hypothetical protein